MANVFAYTAVSTVFFLLQASLALTLYGWTKNLEASLVVVVIATLMLAVVIADATKGGARMAGIPAVPASIAAVLLVAGQGMLALCTGVIALVLSYMVAIMKGPPREDPWPLLMLAAMPLGIGTVFGFAFLGFRRISRI